MIRDTEIIRAINSATETTQSGWIDITSATKVIIIGKRSNHASGATAFSAEIAVDSAGTAATALNILVDNVTNTNAQTLTRVTSKSLSSDTTCVLGIEPMFTGGFLRVTATETTDGTHDVWVIIQY